MNRGRFSPSRPVWRIVLAVVLIATLGTGFQVSAQTPEASPAADLPDGPLGEQIAWIIGVANGEESVTDPAVINDHFSPEFIESVGLQGFIQFAYGLVREFSPVTITSVTTDETGTQAEVGLDSRDGVPLVMAIAVDPASGLVIGLQIVPASEAPGAATPEASPAASPVASPAAEIVPNTAPVTYEEIAPAYNEIVESVSTAGQAVVANFLAGEYQAIVDSMAPDLQASVAAADIEARATLLTTNRVHFEFTEAGAILDGHIAGDTMTGFFTQGGTLNFTLTAETPQSGGAPTGTWSGQIDTLGIGFSVTFAGEADALTATLDIPEQGVTGQPLNNVSFEAERPVGDLIEETALALGEVNTAYRASYAWGSATLVLTVGQDSEGSITGFTQSPQWPLGADPAETTASIDPMFDGAWLAVWSGDSEFLNYHAPSPQQRHAVDLMIWKDGATYAGDGLEVGDYYAYGQTLYAPVAGEVVQVESSFPDLPPYLAQMADPDLMVETSQAARQQGPAGNHVVIKTAEGLFVYLAHMAPGTATVSVGDTVAVGDVIGQVGNTGNTSEPHIHVHVQTALDLNDPASVGLPIQWNNLAVNGESTEQATPVQGDIIEPAGN